MAYDRIDPFGQERADLRSGILASTMANLWGSRMKRYAPQDFMPLVKREIKRDPAALAAKMKAWAHAYNQSRGYE